VRDRLPVGNRALVQSKVLREGHIMPNNASSSRRAFVGVLVLTMLATGCTRRVVHKVARFDPAGSENLAPTSQPVPKVAVWKVKVRGHVEKDYHGIDGTERLLQRGDVVGFHRDEDGVTYAVANREMIPLSLTAEHRRVVWYASIEEQTQFGRELAEVVDFAVAVGAGATVVGVVILVLALSSGDDDECGYGY